MIAGIGGASLGTEIFKCLRDAGNYNIFGCDISAFAYGHYQEGFAGTFTLKPESYVDEVLALCRAKGIRAVIPGGEGPLTLLNSALQVFQNEGIQVASNSREVVEVCSDKKRQFEHLRDLGLPVPASVVVKHASEVDLCGELPLPCIVKPTTGTGGSSMTFLASTHEHMVLYVKFLLSNSKTALVQEYLPEDEGEFTVGVLSLPGIGVVGSIAMQRLFHAKLSVALKTETGLISSGYSQGLIDDFPQIRRDAEEIARAINSTGPINIQGRVCRGTLIPFEINPRFSASTYLRTLAGFNEIDVYLRYVLYGEQSPKVSIRPGYYLRSLDQLMIDKNEVVK